MCKRRHTKCDEARPACINCTSTGLECCYVKPETSSPDYAVSQGQSLTQLPGPGHLGAAAATSDWIHHLIPDLVTDPSLKPDRSCNLEHMRLWHHAEVDINHWLEVTETMQPIGKIYVETALSSSFCMDQLHPLAALHLSTVKYVSTQRYRD